jgi:hypothetical protein
MPSRRHDLATEPAAAVPARVAMLSRIDAAGIPWLRAGGAEVRARVLAQIARAELDRALAEGLPLLVTDEDGDRALPIIVGVVALAAPEPAAADGDAEAPTAEVDGTEVAITGKERIVLRCGQASITLTSAGKIILDGAYISSLSSGVNKVRGGQVRIN